MAKVRISTLIPRFLKLCKTWTSDGIRKCVFSRPGKVVENDTCPIYFIFFPTGQVFNAKLASWYLFEGKKIKILITELPSDSCSWSKLDLGHLNQLFYQTDLQRQTSD